jgi:predicted AlkP superfamily pyrophosphatase or phosphodiesterase
MLPDAQLPALPTTDLSTHRRTPGSVVLLLVALLVATAAVPSARQDPPSAAGAPRLLVLLVIDQFGSIYVDLYRRHWSRGLKALFDSGAVLDGRHPFAHTITCPGHATIATGTVPATHGMIDNTWYDRAQGRFVTCTDDPGAEPIGFGGGRAVEHHSARWMLAPTIGDELQRQYPAARVVTMSYKPRSAITLAGRSGAPNTLAVWQEDNGTWATSSELTKQPWPDVDAFVGARPIAPMRGQLWNKFAPSSAYQFEDNGRGEPTPSTFPHLLDVPVKVAGAGAPFAATWAASPLSDAFLADMAAAIVSGARLGQGESTDMLGISFSALDVVGHAYGPRSHETQDILLHLDAAIEKLRAVLDERVGADNYTLALTADHGIATLPEQVPSGPTGRVLPAAIGSAVDEALSGILGRRAYVDAVSTTAVYFRREAIPRIVADPRARLVIEKAVLGVPGVGSVFWAGDLAARTATNNPVLTAMRASYVAERSGDLAFLPRQNWVVLSLATMHSTPYDYDAKVPIIFIGRGIKPGRYGAAETIDIAPTLAAIAGVDMPTAEGRVLREILR